MPKVIARITCNIGNTTNINQLSSAIENAITAITGGECRVVVNKNSSASSMDAYKLKKSMEHNNIENMRSLGR